MKRSNYKNSIRIFILLFLSINLYAQHEQETPDRTLVDPLLSAYCKKEVESINTMPVKYDTLVSLLHDNSDAFYQLVVLSFDMQGRLRKFFNEYNAESEQNKRTVCFNEAGELVYIESAGGSNCDHTDEYFYVHQGRIIDFGFYYGCGCCEEYEQQAIDERRPLIGNLFIDEREDEKYCISAKNILNYYYKQNNYGNLGYKALILPETFTKEKAPHLDFKENLESLRPFVIMDSIDTPKAYIIRHVGSHLIVIDENERFVSSLLFPYGGISDYEIERLNSNGIGTDKLIVRWKDKFESSNRYGDYTYGRSDEMSNIVIWCLDTYSRLLYITETEKVNYWNIKDPSGEKKITQQSDCTICNVHFTDDRMIIQKFNNCKKDTPGLKYSYKLTESGLVLEKVE